MPCFFTVTGVGTGDSGAAGTCGLSWPLPLLSRMASADDLVGRARKDTRVWTGSVSCGHLGSGL